MTTKQDLLYNKFCEIIAGNEHISLKFSKIQNMVAESVFDVNKIDNDRGLKVDPNNYRKGVLFNGYADYMSTTSHQDRTHS